MKRSFLVGLVFVPAALAAVAIGCGSQQRAGFEGDASATDPAEGGLGFTQDGKGGCTNLECNQVPCSNGQETTVTGTVYAPNGKLPLYNAIVYVPNSEVTPLPSGATCDKCGAVTGSPLVTALSGPDGKFELKNVPVGDDIPLVIQVGKWRRQVVIPKVVACKENELDDRDLTRLPKNQSEGNMPQIALTSGQCDQLGCMLPKIGIDPSEIGIATDGASKAVHLYSGVGPGPFWPDARTLWTNSEQLKNYDMVILSCECQEHLDNKPAGAFEAMGKYLDAGGRIFTTDFMYSWYRYATNEGLKSTMSIRGGAPVGGSPMKFDTSFPKGQALVDWLDFVGATPTKGELSPDVVWGNIISVDTTKAQLWASSGAPLPGPRVISVNTPVGAPAEEQCGKALHIDAHVNQNGADLVGLYYPSSCSSSLTDGENLLAFFFFDLASCIQDESKPPQPPVK